MSTFTSRKAINKVSKGFQYKRLNLYYSKTQKLLKSLPYLFERAWTLTFSFYLLAQIYCTRWISNSFAVLPYSFLRSLIMWDICVYLGFSIYWAIKSSGCDKTVKPITGLKEPSRFLSFIEPWSPFYWFDPLLRASGLVEPTTKRKFLSFLKNNNFYLKKLIQDSLLEILKLEVQLCTGNLLLKSNPHHPLDSGCLCQSSPFYYVEIIIFLLSSNNKDFYFWIFGMGD